MRVWKLLALAALVLAVHGSSGGGGFHYDDEHSVAGNPHIRSLAQVPRFFVDPTLFSVDAERGMAKARLAGAGRADLDLLPHHRLGSAGAVDADGVAHGIRRYRRAARAANSRNGSGSAPAARSRRPRRR